MKNKKRIGWGLEIGLCVVTLLFIVLDVWSDRAFISGDDNLWGWLSLLSFWCMAARWILIACRYRRRKDETDEQLKDEMPQP